jgi:hypothetical protein
MKTSQTYKDYIYARAAKATLKIELQNEIYNQIVTDLESNDGTALEEMLNQLIKNNEALAIVINFLPEDQQEKYLSLLIKY